MFSSSSILTMKIALMSSGVVSLAWAVKHTLIPLIVHFTVSDLPTVWSLFILMFKPPYLYVLFNGIIIIIYAISRFTQNQTQLSSPHLIPSPIPAENAISHAIVVPPPLVVVDGLEVEEEVEKEVVEEGETGEEEEEEEEERVVEVVQDMAPETEVVLQATEKPLELTVFPAQKQSNLNPEGRSNKVRVATRHQRHETLDSTWRMITQGRHSTSFENVENHNLKLNSSARQNSFLRKSATFKDRTNFLHQPLVVSKGIVRKESSLGKEELNRRVEAFINKFNRDMRLQREDSYNRYLEMINHG